MNPYDPSELGRQDPELDGIARELEQQAAAMSGEPPLDLTGRILSAIDDEPMPTSRWALLTGLRGPARLLAAASIVVVAITGTLAIGTLIDRASPDVGGPPTPVVLPSPSETPSASPSPSATPSASPSPSPSPTATVQPSPTDDDDEIETPEPSEFDDDNSGPGGGGGDSSGPGSGGAKTPEPSESDSDNSGPGGGGGDNSGPGGGDD